eukprot:gene10454-2585_t
MRNFSQGTYAQQRDKEKDKQEEDAQPTGRPEQRQLPHKQLRAHTMTKEQSFSTTSHRHLHRGMDGVEAVTDWLGGRGIGFSVRDDSFAVSECNRHATAMAEEAIHQLCEEQSQYLHEFHDPDIRERAKKSIHECRSAALTASEPHVSHYELALDLPPYLRPKEKKPFIIGQQSGLNYMLKFVSLPAILDHCVDREQFLLADSFSCSIEEIESLLTMLDDCITQILRVSFCEIDRRHISASNVLLMFS